MFVYFMQPTRGGPVKIGCAKRPDRRLASFQPASPYPLCIRAVGVGGRMAESTLHRRFAAARVEGREWFEPTAELEALMRSLPTWEAVAAGADCPEVATEDYRDVLLQLWLLGYTYDDIGGLLGVTRQRAHQLIKPLTPEEVKRPDRPTELIEYAFARLSGE